MESKRPIVISEYEGLSKADFYDNITTYKMLFLLNLVSFARKVNFSAAKLDFLCFKKICYKMQF